MKGFILALTCLLVLQAHAALGFSVSGVVRYHKQGVIYVNLVDAEAFAGRGGYGLMLLPPEGNTGGEMAFRFADVPAGMYGLRCFQDLDGDRRLGMGLFGPTEPWAMSWKRKRPFGRPSFEDVSFRVGHDVSGLVLELEE